MSMEKFILSFMGWLQGVDFAAVFRALGLGFLIFWIVIIGWVLSDARERFPSLWMQLLMVALVVALPVFGLFIYFIVRPKSTTEETSLLDLERRYLKFEASGLSDCPSCGLELQPNFVFCPQCGREIRVKCNSCEVYLEPQWRACPFCGMQQESGEEEMVAEDTVCEDGRSTAKTNSSRSRMRKNSEKTENFVDTPGHKVEKPADTEAENTGVQKVAEFQESDGQKDSVVENIWKPEPTKSLTLESKGKAILSQADGFIRYIGRIPVKLLKKIRYKVTAQSITKKITDPDSTQEVD